MTPTILKCCTLKLSLNLNCYTFNKISSPQDFPILMAHHQNVWLISVPTGRFVAVASLSLQKTFVVADASLSHDKTFVADASLSRRAKLPGGVRWAASLAMLAPGFHLWRWSPRSRPAWTKMNLYQFRLGVMQR